MTGDGHVRICGSPGAKFPRATRLREGYPVASKYEFIDTMRLDTAECAFPVTFMCERLHVSTSGYYEWRSRPESATARRREELKQATQPTADPATAWP